MGGVGVNWGQASGSGLVCEFGLRVGARFKCLDGVYRVGGIGEWDWRDGRGCTYREQDEQTKSCFISFPLGPLRMRSQQLTRRRGSRRRRCALGGGCFRKVGNAEGEIPEGEAEKR